MCNGYGSTLPFFIAEYSHFKDIEKEICFKEVNRSVSLGASAYLINIGSILEYGNLSSILTKIEPMQAKNKEGMSDVLALPSLCWFQRSLFQQWLRKEHSEPPVIVHNLYCVEYCLYEAWYNQASKTIKL